MEKVRQEVKDKIVEKGAVYLQHGGAAALIKDNQVCRGNSYEDLGAEAIRKIYVEDFPVTVINDAHGNDHMNQVERNT